MEKANKRARKLEEQIIDTPAASMAGVIAKARCVEKNLCDGKSASYDPDARFAASMAKDLLASHGRTIHSGQTRKSSWPTPTSALPPKADSERTSRHVRKVPIADMHYH
jgi:hypothetical protein